MTRVRGPVSAIVVEANIAEDLVRCRNVISYVLAGLFLAILLCRNAICCLWKTKRQEDLESM